MPCWRCTWRPGWRRGRMAPRGEFGRLGPGEAQQSHEQAIGDERDEDVRLRCAARADGRWAGWVCSISVTMRRPAGIQRKGLVGEDTWRASCSMCHARARTTSRVGQRGGPCCGAAHRRDPSPVAVLRQPAMRASWRSADTRSTARVQRLMRQMDLRALYPRVERPAGQGTQDLPLPAQGPVHRTREPGLGK